jgi:hypothetical protein
VDRCGVGIALSPIAAAAIIPPFKISDVSR